MIDLAPPPLVFPKPAIIRPAADLIRPKEAMFLVAPPFMGSAGLTSVSLSATVTASGGSITWPGSLQAGDVAWVADYSRGSGSSTPDLSGAGFTAIAAGSSSDGKVWYRILTGSESGSFTVADGSSEGSTMYIFRGNVPIVGVTLGSWTQETTTADPSSQTVTASGGAVPLVVLAAIGGNNANPAFTTASPAFDAETWISGQNIRTGYKIYNSSPANHTVDMPDYGTTNYMASGYLAFT